jgi:hypothetical protein
MLHGIVSTSLMKMQISLAWVEECIEVSKTLIRHVKPANRGSDALEFLVQSPFFGI